PTTYLDLRYQTELFAALRAERARGASTVAVMHDLNLAAQADRCVLLAAGAVRGDGPPDAVLRAEILREVYGAELDVIEAPGGRRAVILGGAPRAETAP